MWAFLVFILAAAFGNFFALWFYDRMKEDRKRKKWGLYTLDLIGNLVCLFVFAFGALPVVLWVISLFGDVSLTVN